MTGIQPYSSRVQINDIFLISLLFSTFLNTSNNFFCSIIIYQICRPKVRVFQMQINLIFTLFIYVSKL